MLLSELMDQLTAGELSQLSLGGIDSTGIEECDYPKIIPHINLGLTSLYTRFPIRTQEVIVQQFDHIQNYELNSKYAESNKTSLAQTKYIMDSEFEPFEDNVLRIESVHDEDGKELFLNDSEEYWSVHTKSYNVIHVPWPEQENAMSIMYRANHDTIPIVGANPLTTQINIPPGLLEALLFYIASRVFSNLNTDGAVTEGNTFMQKYEQSCLKAEQYNIVNKDNTANKKLDKNGWV